MDTNDANKDSQNKDLGQNQNQDNTPSVPPVNQQAKNTAQNMPNRDNNKTFMIGVAKPEPLSSPITFEPETKESEKKSLQDPPEIYPHIKSKIVPKPVEKPVEKSKGSAELIKIQSLRTYADDIKSAVESKNISTSKILLSEQKRRNQQIVVQQEEEVEGIDKPKNKIYLVLTILLIVLGGGVLAYTFLIKTDRPVVIAPTPPQNYEFFEIEKQTLVNYEGEDSLDFFEQLATERTELNPPNSIEQLVFIRHDTLIEDEYRTEVENITSTAEFFDLISRRVPESLVRSVSSSFLYGLRGSETSNKTLIVFEIVDFRNTFAGMLDWEEDIVRDLEEIIPALSVRETLIHVPNATLDEILEEEAATDENEEESETATSTSQVFRRQIIFNQRDFKDEIIQNVDIRIIRNYQNETVLMYAFINQDRHIIITDDIEVFKDVQDRFRGSKLSR